MKTVHLRVRKLEERMVNPHKVFDFAALPWAAIVSRLPLGRMYPVEAARRVDPEHA